MVSTRSMARENDSWVQEHEKMRQERKKMRQEREELRLRLELNEIRTKNTEKMLAAIATKLGISKGATSIGDGSENEGEVQRHKTHQNHDRWHKLEIPIFLGEDAYGWVQKLERYFTLKAISEKERMQATMVALEGKALNWYQWWECCNPSPTWESFKIAVVRRFQPSMIQNPFELLLSLKQEGSVEDYVEEFEKYAGALKAINHDFVRKIFLDGLKEEIRVEVMLYKLETLPEVIQKAILIEQKNVIVEKGSIEGYATTAGPYHSNTYNEVVSLDSSTTSNNKRKGSSMESVIVTSRNTQEATNSRSKTNYKRLANAEMKEKREKEMCFRCDELFTRDHVCKNKQLRMILFAEEEDDENEVDVGEGLKVGGTLWDNLGVILIDCGASHNFITRELVNILQLKVEETHAYVVEVGDGHNVRCKGKWAQLKLSMQQLEVIQDFYVFGLKGMALVLGLKWLASLGEVKADFGRMKLTLKKENSVITIARDPALNRTKLSYGAFMQVLLEKRGGLLLHYDTRQCYRQEGEGIPAELEGTLQQYQNVFQNP
ncbi:hypothetical protein Lal_00017002 [Lupinus albus]|nr:hypothetical protein Lal_00017002 [Lupinus albus]